jgi:hypothetical protein
VVRADERRGYRGARSYQRGRPWARAAQTPEYQQRHGFETVVAGQLQRPAKGLLEQHDRDAERDQEQRPARRQRTDEVNNAE